MDYVQRPRLVASDVDGTLLGPMETLSDRTFAVLRRIEAAKVPFVLATGRPPRWIPPVAVPAQLTGYAVCANGAALYDIATDQVVRVHGLEAVQMSDIAHALGPMLPGMSLAAERIAVGDPAVGGADVPFVTELEYSNPWGNRENHNVPRAEVVGRPAVKLLVRHPDMTSDEMAAIAIEVLGDEFDVTFSTGRGLIEVSAPGVTKATGLADAAERLGVEASDVITFGDMPNDVPMLKWAGHGVAMANAHPDALAAADEVTASHAEDGVAQVLERWF
jgi:HAD superfamily hydrolase (TIGR01484 family)